MTVSETLYRKYKKYDRCEELQAYYQILNNILTKANLTDEEQYVIKRILWDIKEEAYERHCGWLGSI